MSHQQQEDSQEKPRDKTLFSLDGPAEETQAAFVAKIWEEGERLYRDFPWRNTEDPYEVLVSEVMLQQTQVNRVLKHWQSFCALFPTVDALAAADTALVLDQWQGLGYNRRALSLKRTAEICSASYGGALPLSFEELLALPGIGQATAAGVFSFAYNKPATYLETNVRTVFIHEFFPDGEEIKDKQLLPLVEATCSEDNPRGWYYALLDYGAFLKKEVLNPSRKSAHHVRQSTFEGSRRQKRAEILRLVLAYPRITREDIFVHLNDFEQKAGRIRVERALLDSILKDMVNEGFFHQDEEVFFT